MEYLGSPGTTRALKAAEYYLFVEFIATPENIRELRSQNEFCERYNVSKDTLWRWKKDPNFWEDVRRVIADWTQDKTTNVLASLYESCLVRVGPRGGVRLPDPQAIKLWLQYVEKFSEKTVHEERREIGENLRDLLMRKYEERQGRLKNADSTNTTTGHRHSGTEDSE